MNWTKDEFKTLDFGDERLNARAKCLAARLGGKPAESIPMPAMAGPKRKRLGASRAIHALAGRHCCKRTGPAVSNACAGRECRSTRRPNWMGVNQDHST